uniref:Uncharacterized protein n=1 Tax=Magallana gigas TaxID=29159 RepID=K1Q1S5_MAGGI
MYGDSRWLDETILNYGVVATVAGGNGPNSKKNSEMVLPQLGFEVNLVRDGRKCPAAVYYAYPNVRRHFRSSPEGNKKKSTDEYNEGYK